MAQQTAVEWLINQLQEGRATFFKINDNEERIITLAGKDVVQQAKQMEKEQILNACYQFSDYPFNKEDHLEYYRETYESSNRI